MSFFSRVTECSRFSFFSEHSSSAALSARLPTKLSHRSLSPWFIHPTAQLSLHLTSLPSSSLYFRSQSGPFICVLYWQLKIRINILPTTFSLTSKTNLFLYWSFPSEWHNHSASYSDKSFRNHLYHFFLTHQIMRSIFQMFLESGFSFLLL